jgi:hypothetical protein
MKTFIKNKIGNIYLIILTLIILPVNISFALPQPDLGNKSDSQNSNNSSVSESDLFYRFQYSGIKEEGNGKIQTKIGAVNALPDKTWQQTLANIIKILLNISGGLLLISTTVSGVIMITSTGNPDMTDKGKKLLIASIAGIVIVSVSYALVIGVSQLQIFQPGTAGNNSTSSNSTNSQTTTPNSGVAGGTTQ